MSGDTPAKPRMSLYANLLNSSNSDGKDAPGTISGAPVVYKQSSSDVKSNEDILAAAKSKLSAAALRFQPTKRPTATPQKPKGLVPRPGPASAQSSAVPPPPPPPPDHPAETPDSASRQQPSKPTLEDWAGDADEDAYYLEQKRQQQQRGGRKKRKKNKENRPQPVNWDDIYDPSRPNNYDEYKHSEESLREAQDWKDVLYAHRMVRRDSSLSDSEEDRPKPRFKNQFAPPSMSFAPPAESNEDSTPPPPPPPPAEPINVVNDTTGEDAYARRMRLSQQTQSQLPPPPPDVSEPPNRANLPPPDISRAPVRYSLPAAPADIPASEAELEDALMQEAEDPTPADEISSDQPRSLRPGQKGFAERMMKKYGWTKGSGLGAQGTGITTALSVKVEKAKRKPDVEGGGFVGGTQGRGKIMGGKKSAASEPEGGKFGPMSEVIVLLGMVDGMDLQRELGEGNLMQEIGEECGEKYGRVERVFIDQSTQGSVPVFVKFISQLSALRAVNALEGRIFNGNAITARFFDKDRFDQGDFAT